VYEEAGVRLALLCLALVGCKPEPKVPRLVETFGIETAGDEFTTIFPAGAALPTSFESTFSTQDDLQPTFKVRFISGVGVSAKSARTVLELVVPIEHPAPCAVPVIEVKVKVSETGKVSFHAHERGSSTSLDRDDLQLAVGR